jgi:predicted transcriptional regulator of viral defense system
MIEQFVEKINKLSKDYFTLRDFEKIWEGKKSSLKVILSRLTRKGKLKRIAREFYILPEKILEIEKICNNIYVPSYLSFENALSKWGILSQIPYVLTFATPLKTKKIVLENIVVEYRKIKKDLFFGFKMTKGMYIAEPEKALLDTFYLASLGKLKISFRELDYTKIRKKIFLVFLRKYPSKTKKLAKTYL